MNTLESAFKDWLFRIGIKPSEEHMSDLRDAYNAGYLDGFDYAKKEAIRSMNDALREPTP